MRVTFTSQGWEDYQSWASDRKSLLRVNRLINEACRTPGEGTGKPERLRGDLGGYWSRRIDQEHRLVYAVDADMLTIIQARYHY